MLEKVFTLFIPIIIKIIERCSTQDIILVLDAIAHLMDNDTCICEHKTSKHHGHRKED